MSLTHDKQVWLERRPRQGDTCVFTHGYGGFGKDNRAWLVSEWKRDALLFDRVYARCLDPKNPPDIPLELSFGIAECDSQVQSYDASMGQMVAQAYAGYSFEEIAKLHPSIFDECDFDRELSQRYSQVGVMGEWTYSAKGPYLRRFTEGESIAYEGALNNIPLISSADVPWEQIVSFRSDPDASRKYRDLRLWLRAGLGAQSVGHATDLIGQKIDDYRWAIQKHGFQTSLGAMTELFDWKESRLALAAAGVAGIFGGPMWAAIASGMTIVAKVGVSLCERKLASSEVRRGPDRAIAILYDAQERFKSQSGGPKEP